MSILARYRGAVNSFQTQFSIEYLIIGGGGGGGGDIGGGGGAGGYRSSVIGENSGNNSPAEPIVQVNLGETFEVTVGAGSPGVLADSGGTVSSDGLNGVATSIVFPAETISALGGGGGGGYLNVSPFSSRPGKSGGSGGGGSYAVQGGNGSVYGTSGGSGNNTVSHGRASGGGGGGASASGANAPSQDNGGAGGAGISSSITGTLVTRGGGGGGGIGNNSTGSGGAAGTGGGGEGGDLALFSGTPGDINTGGGGGGSIGGQAVDFQKGSSGGSGVVILRYPAKLRLTVGSGLISSTTTSGVVKITQFTAGTDTITVG